MLPSGRPTAWLLRLLVLTLSISHHHPGVLGWYRDGLNVVLREGFKVMGSSSTPVSFVRGKQELVHYLVVLPEQGKEKQQQMLRSMHWEYGDNVINELGLEYCYYYFDGIWNRTKPTWAEPFLVGNDINTTLDDVYYWAPHLQAGPGGAPLRNYWELYFTMYNRATRRTCIGRATANLTELELRKLPAYGPRDWTSEREPIMCTVGLGFTRFWNYSYDITSLRLNGTVNIAREVPEPNQDRLDYLEFNVQPTTRNDVWEKEPEDPDVFPEWIRGEAPSGCRTPMPSVSAVPSPMPTNHSQRKYSVSPTTYVSPYINYPTNEPTTRSPTLSPTPYVQCRRYFGEAMEQTTFEGKNGSLWMVYGSIKFSHSEHQRGLWVVQLDPKTGHLFNASAGDRSEDTPGNFSIYPQQIFAGRKNTSVTAPFIFKHTAEPKANISSDYIRPRPYNLTSKSCPECITYYYLLYTEGAPSTDEYYWKNQEYDGPVPAYNQPKNYGNFTFSIRMARAENPWGPFFDRDGNQIGTPQCCSLLMNTSVVEHIRDYSIKHFWFNGAYRVQTPFRWRKEKWNKLWDTFSGRTRKGSIGYGPFCEPTQAGIIKYWPSKFGDPQDKWTGHAHSAPPEWAISFNFKQCNPFGQGFQEVPLTYFATYKMEWGATPNATKEDPWPELSGEAWDPYDFVYPPPPPSILIYIILGSIGLFFCIIGCIFTAVKWKQFKANRIDPGTIVRLKRPLYRCVCDIIEIICNECTYWLCGRICCSCKTKNEVLVDKYSDAIGAVLDTMEKYDIPERPVFPRYLCCGKCLKCGTYKGGYGVRGGRISWLKKWQSVDKDGDNKLDQAEFTALLKLDPDVWSARLFEFYNRDFNGTVPLRDFVDVSYSLLVYDRPMTYQTAFRLVSRRGQSFNSNLDVIDKEDLHHFFQHRYPEKNDATHQALALAVYSYIDDDGSGGISYQEFLTFCRTNLTFVVHAHRMLEKVRQGVMGSKFWVQETLRLQDIFIYDQKFFSRVEKHEKKLRPPYDFKVDFPEVYARKLEEKSMRLLKKKEAAIKNDQSNHRAFKRITQALNTLGANATGLNMRYAFYRWKDTVDEEIANEKGGGKGSLDPVRATSKVWVSILGAQDLVAADSGGTSDPFAVAVLVDGLTGKTCRYRGKERKLKTNTISKTLNPTWGEDGVIMWDEIIEPVETLTLRVSVFDADTLGSDPLGEVSFKIADTPVAPRPSLEGWFTLQTPEGMKVKATGALNLKMRHLPKTVSSKGLVAVATEGADAPVKAAPKTVWFTLLRAQDLLAADAGGTSDPFATIELFNMVTGKPAKKPRRTKTKTVKKTLHPVWEEKEVVWANIQDNIEELALQVTIFDADMVTNDTLGEATVPLLTFGREATETCHPLKRVGKMTKDATGEVFVRGRLDSSSATDQSTPEETGEEEETKAPDGSSAFVEAKAKLIADGPGAVEDDQTVTDRIIANAMAEMEGQEMPATAAMKEGVGGGGGGGEPQTDPPTDDPKTALLIAIPPDNGASGGLPTGPLSPTSPTGGMNSAHYELHRKIVADKNKTKMTAEEVLGTLQEDLVERLHTPQHLRGKKKVGRLCDAHVALDVHDAPATSNTASRHGATDFERDLDHFESVAFDEADDEEPFL